MSREHRRDTGGQDPYCSGKPKLAERFNCEPLNSVSTRSAALFNVSTRVVLTPHRSRAGGGAASCAVNVAGKPIMAGRGVDVVVASALTI